MCGHIVFPVRDRCLYPHCNSRYKCSYFWPSPQEGWRTAHSLLALPIAVVSCVFLPLSLPIQNPIPPPPAILPSDPAFSEPAVSLVL